MHTYIHTWPSPWQVKPESRLEREEKPNVPPTMEHQPLIRYRYMHANGNTPQSTWTDGKTPHCHGLAAAAAASASASVFAHRDRIALPSTPPSTRCAASGAVPSLLLFPSGEEGGVPLAMQGGVWPWSGWRLRACQLRTRRMDRFASIAVYWYIAQAAVSGFRRGLALPAVRHNNLYF